MCKFWECEGNACRQVGVSGEQVLLGSEDAQLRSLPGVMDYGVCHLGCFGCQVNSKAIYYLAELESCSVHSFAVLSGLFCLTAGFIPGSASS